MIFGEALKNRKKNFFSNFTFGSAGSLLVCGLSLLVVSGDYSAVFVQRLVVVVASLLQAWALGSVGSVVWTPRLEGTGSIVGTGA